MKQALELGSQLHLLLQYKLGQVIDLFWFSLDPQVFGGMWFIWEVALGSLWREDEHLPGWKVKTIALCRDWHCGQQGLS